MIWAFIDYENIGSLDSIQMDRYQRILVFCGPKNTKINIGKTTFSKFINLEIIKLKTTGSNNLDFHIAYYLGIYSKIAEQQVEFHVISKDNGFNGLINHIKQTGRKCKKVTLQSKVKSKKTVVFSLCAKLAIKRLKQIDGRKRPRKQDKLENWIASQCRSVDDNINSQAIVMELIKAGMITHSDTGVKYQFKS